MSGLNNMFVIRGKLAAQPATRTFGKTTVTSIIVQSDREYQKDGETRVFSEFVNCEARQFDIDPSELTGLKVGSEILVTGTLGGRKAERDGQDVYYSTIQAKQVAAGTAEEMPF